MILRTALRGIVLFLLLIGRSANAQDDDSLAGSFLSGLLDSITSTAKSADCPGVCVHALATLMCDEVLEDVQCPTSSMRCCVIESVNSSSSSSSDENYLEQTTTMIPVVLSSTIPSTTTTTTTTPTTTTTATTTTTMTTTKSTTISTSGSATSNKVS
ncbi:hypothetical protein M0802_012985 [Mischocyttarus mexicanus]|nr:hypothetical protein M0802_012992 [Mischocyttarus mexicanus]KAI4484892.1 hypothetical protein M0802_012985 [Mischocyttarus mexicanus]